MSEAELNPGKQRVEAKILDIIDNEDGNTIYTKGGLELTTNDMDGIYRCVTKPVTEKGRTTLDRAIEYYERNYDINRTPSQGPRRKYTPVTTLEVDDAAIEVPQPEDDNANKTNDIKEGAGKRNKSKKPKRRNSRSKRRKTVSKRRR